MTTPAGWNEGMPIPDAMSDSPLNDTLSVYWDGFDVWGSAMAEGLALCDFVAFHLDMPEEIPSELGYQPSICGADDEDALYQSLVDAFEYGDFTVADALDYLPILNEYLDRCKAAGLDY